MTRVLLGALGLLTLAILSLAAAVAPASALLCAPLLVLAGVGAAHPTVSTRMAAIGGATAGVFLLTVLATVNPSLAAGCAPLLGVAAAVVAYPAAVIRALSVAARVVAVVGAGLAVVATVVITAVSPSAAPAVAVGSIAFAVVWKERRRQVRGVPVPAVALGVLVVLVALYAWPVTVSLAAAVGAILVMARRAPFLALGAAVLLVGFEGSVKLLLGLEPTPLPGGNRAGGAAAIDLALFGAIAGVLIDDRLRTPRALWARATRLERAVIVMLGLWLALSVVQIAQGGDLSRGLSGFRLFQAYTLVAVAAAVLFARPRIAWQATQWVLAIGLVVGFYAAFRVLVGPSSAEYDFAISIQSVVSYGGVVRAIGSFSSAVGLISFLAPMTGFALVLGFLDRRARRLAWAVAALCLVALIGSYGRASLFGLALGLVSALVVVLAAADMSMRRKLAAAALMLALAGALYGGVLIASEASPQLHERAKGIVNPLADESLRLRFGTWGKLLEDTVDEPLGHGVGAAGSASASTRARFVTTDNSFLKVLFEQGFLGFGLFVGGLVGAAALLARRFRRAASESRAIGLAALAGFLSFVGLSLSGEYVEQPGKVIAWGLLGVAAAQALRDPGDLSEDEIR